MSLIIDINPVPWEILEQVKARILKNRAKKQKRQPDKGKDLRRVMQVDNGILAKQRWEEPSFIGGEPIYRISVLFTWFDAEYPATTLGGIDPEFLFRDVTIPFYSPTGYGKTLFGYGYPGYGQSYGRHVFFLDKINNDYPGLATCKVFLVPNPYPYFSKGLTTVYVYAFTETQWLEFESYTTNDRRNEIDAECLLFQGSPGQTGTLEVQLNGSGATLT